jgi:hypothetical protein
VPFLGTGKPNAEVRLQGRTDNDLVEEVGEVRFPDKPGAQGADQLGELQRRNEDQPGRPQTVGIQPDEMKDITKGIVILRDREDAGECQYPSWTTAYHVFRDQLVQMRNLADKRLREGGGLRHEGRLREGRADGGPLPRKTRSATRIPPTPFNAAHHIWGGFSTNSSCSSPPLQSYSS